MMRRITGCALLSIGLAASGLARQQLISNGSFEDVIDPNNFNMWNEFSDPTAVNTPVADGAFSALISVRNFSFVGVYQDTGVSVGENVRMYMQALARHPAAAPLTGAVKAGIKIEFGPPEGLEQPPPEENLGFNDTSPLDVWTNITLATVVPAEVSLAKAVIIDFDESITNGFVYADSAFCAFASAPATNILLNPSFESGTSAANGLTNWTEFAGGFSGARRATFISGLPPHDGTAVVRMGGETTCGLAQDISTAGHELEGITLSCFYRNRSTESPAWADPIVSAGVKLEWVVGGIPVPGQIDIAPNGNPVSATTNIIEEGDPTDVWIPVTIDWTMEEDTAASLRATVINGFGTATADAFFDSVELVLTNVFNGSDVDADDDEDMVDILWLQRTFTGVGGPNKFLGLVYDHDEDGDVDIDDSNIVLPLMTGPAVAP